MRINKSASILFLTMAGIAQAANMDNLLDAIKRVESGDNAQAVGDNGLARGAYQIHKDHWLDGCRLLKVDWSYSQAFDEAKSRRLVRAYLEHYGAGMGLEVKARIHNGGPQGHKKEATKKYWLKIEKELKKCAKNYKI